MSASVILDLKKVISGRTGDACKAPVVETQEVGLRQLGDEIGKAAVNPTLETEADAV